MRRLLLAVALAGIAAVAPLSAVDKYVVYGDSITTGTSWPCTNDPEIPICPIIFDCVPGCVVTEAGRDECGHTRRLQDWLPGSYVRNEGVAGENSFEGKVRFPVEMDENCGAPGDCVAVILMHGTNDMGTVAPETVRDNLAMMIADAKSRNIDTLLMTIIRDYNPNASAWSAYRDLVAALADTEDLQLVDTHAHLCDDASCRDLNYFLEDASPCHYDDMLSVAHLDPDGYDVLTGLIQAQFPAVPPGMPAPSSPAGPITDPTPDFVWLEAATARWYKLDVGGEITWWEAADHCDAGTCTVNPGVALGETQHLWKVRGRNLRGLGDPSDDTAFEVWAVPGTPTATEPQGAHFDADPVNPPFGWEPYEWSAAADATDYDVVVSDGGGSVFMQSFDSSSCSGSACSGSPGEGLAAGEYTWTVQARNPGASGPVSAPLAFEIVDQVPDAPTPTGPTGKRFEPLAPLYTWLPVFGAVEYDLEVEDSGMNVDASVTGLLASAVCAGGQCSHQGATLPDPDDYTLRVRARNPFGNGMWSPTGAQFTILACADPAQKTLESLAPPPVTGPPPVVVEHCGPVTVAAMAPYSVDASGDLTILTRDGFTASSGFSVAGRLKIQSP